MGWKYADRSATNWEKKHSQYYAWVNTVRPRNRQRVFLYSLLSYRSHHSGHSVLDYISRLSRVSMKWFSILKIDSSSHEELCSFTPKLFNYRFDGSFSGKYSDSFGALIAQCDILIKCICLYFAPNAWNIVYISIQCGHSLYGGNPMVHLNCMSMWIFRSADIVYYRMLNTHCSNSYENNKIHNFSNYRRHKQL